MNKFQHEGIRNMASKVTHKRTCPKSSGVGTRGYVDQDIAPTRPHNPRTTLNLLPRAQQIATEIQSQGDSSYSQCERVAWSRIGDWIFANHVEHVEHGFQADIVAGLLARDITR